MFAIVMLLCCLLIPVIMLIAGYLMANKPPKKINGLMGYRTTMSMKNMDTWLFAHELCGRIWLKVGYRMLFATLIVFVPFMNRGTDSVSNVTMVLQFLQLIVLCATIVPVEKALKKTFDRNGNRK